MHPPIVIMPNITAKSIPSNNQHHAGGIAPGTTAGGLVLDACYAKVRCDGVIRSQAVQLAIGINAWCTVS